MGIGDRKFFELFLNNNSQFNAVKSVQNCSHVTESDVYLPQLVVSLGGPTYCFLMRISTLIFLIFLKIFKYEFCEKEGNYFRNKMKKVVKPVNVLQKGR